MQRRAEIKCQKGLLPTDPIRFVASVQGIGFMGNGFRVKQGLGFRVQEEEEGEVEEVEQRDVVVNCYPSLGPPWTTL